MQTLQVLIKISKVFRFKETNNGWRTNQEANPQNNQSPDIPKNNINPEPIDIVENQQLPQNQEENKIEVKKEKGEANKERDEDQKEENIKEDETKKRIKEYGGINEERGTEDPKEKTEEEIEIVLRKGKIEMNI